MVASLVLFVAQREISNPLPSWTGLVLETILLMAFGFSWLVKSGYLNVFADPDRPHVPDTHQD